MGKHFSKIVYTTSSPSFAKSVERDTREKRMRNKWPCEILWARRARKEGLPTKPEKLTFHGRVIFRCQFPHLDFLSLSPFVNSPGSFLEGSHSTLQVARRKQSKHAVRRMSSLSKTSKEVVKGRPEKEPSCNDFAMSIDVTSKVITEILNAESGV